MGRQEAEGIPGFMAFSEEPIKSTALSEKNAAELTKSAAEFLKSTVLLSTPCAG